MAVVATYSFEARPGRFPDHLEKAVEAQSVLRELGLAALALQPVVGGRGDELMMIVQHDDMASYTQSLQRFQTEERWLEWYAAYRSADIATPIETSVLTDLDPTYHPPADRVLGCVSATMWRPYNGRAGDFLGQVDAGIKHIARLGGAPRVLRTAIGGLPLTTGVSIAFEDVAHYGEFADKAGVDEQWNTFWAGVMADPTADLVLSALLVPVAP